MLNIASDFYCKDWIAVPTIYGVATMTPLITYNIYIYGNLTINTNLTSIDTYLINLNTNFANSVYLMGANNYINGTGNSLTNFINCNFYINGNYTLSRDINFSFYMLNVGVSYNFKVNGTLNTNSYKVIINQTTSSSGGSLLGFFTIDFNGSSVDKLHIYNGNLYPTMIKIKNVTINTELMLIGNGNYLVVTNNYIQASDATNTITLGASCSYYILNASLKNLIFNIPITGWNCVYTNCTNITNITNPQTNISIH